ncbi:MAG: hypothetical protein QCI00_00870 [Candidatus Thermoplasmatota archaeon]|nr:hypothetical protein [Candidatus Thermoplasmatota archaeon]
MGKNTRLGIVISIVFMMLILTTFSVAYQQYNSMNRLSNKNEDNLQLEEKGLDVKKILKNLFSRRSDTGNPLLEFFTSTITTTCEGIEKESSILFGLPNELDVDNDEDTGINGKDIRVQYYLVPWIRIDTSFALGLKFIVNIQRIGEEIKNKDFNITATLGDDILSVGYWAPKKSGNEIPISIQLSALLFFDAADGSTGITVSVEPTYSTNIVNKKLVFFNSYSSEHENSTYYNHFSFDPPSKTDITIASTREPNRWNYTLTRNTEYDTILTLGRSKILPTETKETIFTFDKFPKTVSFSLRITPFSSEGGSIDYTSDSTYDMDVIIQTNELGACNYAIIKNTPRTLFAEWLPLKEQGWYHLEIDSDGTDIILLDSLENPSINLSIHGITDVDMTAFWNFTNPGDLRILKKPSFHINLSFIIGVWEARLDAQPVSEEIIVSWLTNITGYLTYDTNMQPLNQMDLLIKGSDLGIRTIAETFKARDFRLDWTIWPPIEWNVNSTGEIDFLSLLIEVYIAGQWYRLWPWS